MKLDPRTVIFLIIVVQTVTGMGMLLVSRGYLAQVRGVANWAWTCLISALGWIFLALLRGFIPEWCSVSLGNGLILLSFIFHLRILANFVGQPLRTRWLWLVLLAQQAALLYFLLVRPDFSVRLLVLCFCLSLLCGWIAKVLLGRPLTPVRSHWFLGGLYAACAVLLAGRFVLTLLSPPAPGQAVFLASGANDVSYLSFFVIASMLSFGFVLMCNDRYILQKQQAEQAVRDGNDLLTRLASQVPGLIYQFQLFPDGRACMPYASEGIREIYELEPEAVRQDIAALTQMLHPDDLDGLLASVQASAKSLQPWHHEYRVVLPRQGLRWRSGYAQPAPQPDGSILWHGFITDITDMALAKEKEKVLEQQVRAGYDALLSSEKRSRLLMNSGLIGVIHGNAAGQLLDANPVFLRMSGYSRLNLAYGALNWLDMALPAAREQMQTVLQDLAKLGPTQFEGQLQASDDHLIPVMLGLVALEGSENEWVGFVLDLTEQRRIDHLKSEFISVVSHELRTPLTSIRGSLGLLEGGMAGPLPDKALHLIRIAHKNSQRLVGLVNDILDMEKLASGKMTLHMEALDLLQLARQAIEANAAYAAGFQVQYVLQTSLEMAPVVADADRLMQVFANLMSNAAKFSPPGAQVELKVMVLVRSMRVEIVDHGKGIPQAFRGAIFGKFAQADASATRHLEGAGLGLHITRTLIEKMDGKIGFESEEGEGTVFWFELPLLTSF